MAGIAMILRYISESGLTESEAWSYSKAVSPLGCGVAGCSDIVHLFSSRKVKPVIRFLEVFLKHKQR
jgi:hypothetical protein